MSNKVQKVHGVKQRPLSESEAKLQRKVLELLHDDIKNVCNPVCGKSFSSKQDAIKRLLPYHIFKGVREKDLINEEISTIDGTLVCSHQQSRDNWVQKQAEVAVGIVEKTRKRILEVEGRYSKRLKELLGEELILNDRQLLIESQRNLDFEKSKPQGIVNSDSDSDCE
mmetsp:Transcript_29966/g.54824  ORF Transcript_29966/g.54824 Transcript_29966/m.54824 type:complete len:168 (-) Transcript_29966:272-775(-)